MNIKLSDREETVLRVIVDEYINSSQPVGSRYVSKTGFLSLSPASIRNIMSDLKDKGYIIQPHTSSGRVPTDTGFKYYIDKFIAISNNDLQDLQNEFRDLNDVNVRSIFDSISRKLGDLTHSIGFVISPKLNTMYLKHIEFIRLNSDTVLTVIVTKSGIVHNMLMNIDESIKDNDLVRVANYLNDKFKDKTLLEVKEQLVNEMRDNKDKVNELTEKVIKVSQNLFDDADFGSEIILHGTSNIIGQPEFKDTEKLKDFLKAFEEKHFAYQILERCMRENGVKIFIGSDLGSDSVEELGLVTKPYLRDDKTIGTLGVIGPKRMKYPEVIPIVDFTAEIITNLLKKLGGSNDK